MAEGSGRRTCSSNWTTPSFTTLFTGLMPSRHRVTGFGLALSPAHRTLAEVFSTHGWITHAAGILGLWIAFWWCYFAVGWGLLGATIGKWVFSLRIVDHRGRSPIGLSRAFLRLAAYSVSSVTLGMGHLLIALRPDRRALHDVLAGTWVVRRPKTTQPAPTTEDETDANDDIDNS